jgi:hypothetical protein
VNPDHTTILPFILVWVALAIAGGVFFMTNRDAALKRRVYPAFMIGAALLFLAFITFGARMGSTVLIAIPFVALVVVMNLRQVRFCDACGRTVQGSNPLVPPKFCPGCGAPLV